MKATDAHNRATWNLYEHLRIYHAISPGVLSRLKSLRDLEDFHADLDCEALR